MPAWNVRRSIIRSRRLPAVVGYADRGAIGSGPWDAPSLQAGRESSRSLATLLTTRRYPAMKRDRQGSVPPLGAPCRGHHDRTPTTPVRMRPYVALIDQS